MVDRGAWDVLSLLLVVDGEAWNRRGWLLLIGGQRVWKRYHEHHSLNQAGYGRQHSATSGPAEIGLVEEDEVKSRVET